MLGTFDTKQEAALAYDRKARQCTESGVYKPLNYESIEAVEEAAAQAQAEHILIYSKQPKPRPSSGFYGVSAKGRSGGERGSPTAASGTTSASSTPSRRQHSHTTGWQGSAGRTSR